MRKLSTKYENPIDNFLYIYVEILAPYMNKLNISPNMITTLGNICWIYGCYLVYKDNNFLFGGLLFAVSYFFDCLDGYVARKYKQISIFGDYYDHISDVTRAITFTLLLYYKNKKLFMKLMPIIILLSIPLCMHLYLQEKIHGKKNDSPTLSLIEKIVPPYFKTYTVSDTKKLLTFTRWGGGGTWNLLFSLFIIYFGFHKTTKKK